MASEGRGHDSWDVQRSGEVELGSYGLPVVLLGRFTSPKSLGGLDGNKLSSFRTQTDVLRSFLLDFSDDSPAPKRSRPSSRPSSAKPSENEFDSDQDLVEDFQSSDGSDFGGGDDYRPTKMPSDDEDEDEGDEEFVPEKRVATRKSKLKLSGSSKALYSTDAGPSSRLKIAPSTGEAKRAGGSDLVSSVFPEDRDFTFLPLKPDHATRPYYISPASGNIILEAFHPLAAQATDFLIAIAEPVSRPSHIHEYKLTDHSLYAAVSVGLKTENIIEVLNRMSKVPVPDEISEFIRSRTVSFGKVKLVLKKNKHYVESGHPETLRTLLRDEIIAQARVMPVEGEVAGGETATYGLEKEKAPKRAGLVIPGTKAAGAPGEEGSAGVDKGKGKGKEVVTEDDLFTAVIGLEKGKLSLHSLTHVVLNLTPR